MRRRIAQTRGLAVQLGGGRRVALDALAVFERQRLRAQQLAFGRLDVAFLDQRVRRQRARGGQQQGQTQRERCGAMGVSLQCAHAGGHSRVGDFSPPRRPPSIPDPAARRALGDQPLEPAQSASPRCLALVTQCTTLRLKPGGSACQKAHAALSARRRFSNAAPKRSLLPAGDS